MRVKEQLFLIVQILFGFFLIATCYGFNFGEQYQLPFFCDPVADCANGTYGDKVPDPNDCNNYYLCIEVEGTDTPYPSNNPVPCGTGSIFDQEEGDCVAGISCQNLCVNMCKTTCDAVGDYIFDPCDPMKFYICLEAGPPIEAECPDKTPYFNGFNCTNNEDDVCDNCTPFCSDINIETIDPIDCRSYYLCIEKGVPSEDTHFECQDGEFFDPEVGTCVEEGRPCTSLCSCNIEETTTFLTTVISSAPATEKPTALTTELLTIAKTTESISTTPETPTETPTETSPETSTNTPTETAPETPTAVHSSST